MNPKKANTIFWTLLIIGALVGGIGSTEGVKWMSMLGIVQNVHRQSMKEFIR